MCQLNVYVVPKCIEEDLVRECFDNPEIVGNITSRFNIETLKNYNFYSYTCHCNCGSIVSRIAGNGKPTETGPYADVVIKEYKEKLEKLYSMKDFMEKPGYEEKFKKYRKEREKLFNKYLKLQQKMDYLEAIETPEYLAYSNFVDANPLLEESELYSLKPSPGWPFKTIDEQIKELEENLERGYEVCEEFLEIKKQLENLLKVSPEVKMFAYWMDDEPSSLNKGKVIKFDELNEDSFVYLPYEELLTITK
jgi:hypothetical protein